MRPKKIPLTVLSEVEEKAILAFRKNDPSCLLIMFSILYKRLSHHSWTNRQVERMNRTLKRATVNTFTHATDQQLKEHLHVYLVTLLKD